MKFFNLNFSFHKKNCLNCKCSTEDNSKELFVLTYYLIFVSIIRESWNYILPNILNIYPLLTYFAEFCLQSANVSLSKEIPNNCLVSYLILVPGRMLFIFINLDVYISLKYSYHIIYLRSQKPQWRWKWKLTSYCSEPATSEDIQTCK